MVNEPHGSNLMDPLQGHSVLSLFPRTFRDSKDALKPKDSDDLESIHHYMKSMALRSSDKLFEKAKALVDGHSELLNTKFASFSALGNKNEGVDAKGKENPQERRPALGRKRARFSLKPDTRQPSTSLEPSFQIDQLQDPEEFFAAYEKFENAKKELQKQRGNHDLNEVNLPMNARRRRPGISGKKVSYKHHHYSVHSESDFSSSRETLQHRIRIPSKYDSQQELVIPYVESQENELDVSITKTENRVNDLFDELMSSNIENLDEDGTLSLLQDHLSIKPVDQEKLCLPDFHDVGRTDFVYLGEKIPKDRSTLSDIHNLTKLRGKTPVKQKLLADSPIHPLSSPTPSKSPFASISLLGKYILKSSTLVDPFSACNSDLSPATSPVELLNGQSDHVSTRKMLSISGKLGSSVSGEVTSATAAMDSQKVPRGDSIDLFDTSVNDNLSNFDLGIGVGPTGSHHNLEDHDPCNNMDERAMDDNVIGPNTDTDVQMNEQNTMEKDAEDTLQTAGSSAQPDINMEGLTNTDVQPHRLREIDENVEDLQQNAASCRSLLGQTNPTAATEDHASDGPSKTPEIGPEEQNEEYPRTYLNEQRKTNIRQGDQRKMLSRRQSLAEAGTFWKSGVRRSNRVKTRPLEYWKGERFLYGRVHNTLPTVIGLKYISPTKNSGNPTFRVESYVSDDYKELVELAALH